MNIKPIKSEAEYDAALTAIDGPDGRRAGHTGERRTPGSRYPRRSLRSGALADRGTGSNLGESSMSWSPEASSRRTSLS